MPKPLTTAVSKILVTDLLVWLEEKLAEVKREDEANTGRDYYARRGDMLHSRGCYLELALRQCLGAVGGTEAEAKLKLILGTADEYTFGSSALEAAESTVRLAREDRLTARRTRASARAAA